MSLFEKVKKYRLSIMLLVPLLFMLAFVTTVVIDKWRLTREIAAVQELTGVSVKVSHLVHELQKERGMSAGLLGSKGAQFLSLIHI